MGQINNNQKKSVAKRCVKPNESRLMQQAEQGNPRAQVKLGLWYEEVMEDPDEASKWYKAAAEQGYALAQYLLGFYYYKQGYRVNNSMKEAGKWFRKAAEQEFSPAQERLGEWYMCGHPPVKKNEKLAVRWYKKAANHYNEEAAYSLALYYGDSENSDYDPKKYFYWLDLAAEYGHVEAQKSLAECYLYGWDVEKSMTKAVEWYEKAALQNDKEAQYQLGCFYYFGYVVKQDYSMAVEWFIRAADNENVKGCQFLGHCYYKGLGVEKDYCKALEWFVKAHNLPKQEDYHITVLYDNEDVSLDEIKEKAKQGDSNAQCIIGLRYYADQKMAEAYKWLCLSAEQDYMSAQQYLGYCYYAGLGVDKDDSEALKWFDKATIKLLDLE